MNETTPKRNGLKKEKIGLYSCENRKTTPGNASPNL
jgi:hypothetical protein